MDFAVFRFVGERPLNCKISDNCESFNDSKLQYSRSDAYDVSSITGSGEDELIVDILVDGLEFFVMDDASFDNENMAKVVVELPSI